MGLLDRERGVELNLGDLLGGGGNASIGDLKCTMTRPLTAQGLVTLSSHVGVLSGHVVALGCNLLLPAATCCNLLQPVAICCSLLQPCKNRREPTEACNCLASSRTTLGDA